LCFFYILTFGRYCNICYVLSHLIELLTNQTRTTWRDNSFHMDFYRVSGAGFSVYHLMLPPYGVGYGILLGVGGRGRYKQLQNIQKSSVYPKTSRLFMDFHKNLGKFLRLWNWSSDFKSYLIILFISTCFEISNIQN